MGDGCRELLENYPQLAPLREDLFKAVRLLADTYRSGGQLLLCGNGGSASDSLHIAGELMKGFTKKRPLETSQKEKLIQSGLPTALCEKLQQGMRAIPLTGQAALNTAVINDQDPALIYAQQVYVLGRPGDLLLALSTSGNAENVKNAVCTAKALGLTVIGLTGEPGGWLGTHADLSLRAPARETYRVQEYHLPIYHAICREVEEALFLE